MGKILTFPERRLNAELVKLKQTSDAIDDVILEALLNKGLSAQELAGLLAHRLGTMLRTLEAKASLWDVCAEVAKKQAVLD